MSLIHWSLFILVKIQVSAVLGVLSYGDKHWKKSDNWQSLSLNFTRIKAIDTYSYNDACNILKSWSGYKRANHKRAKATKERKQKSEVTKERMVQKSEVTKERMAQKSEVTKERMAQKSEITKEQFFFKKERIL